MYTNYKTYANVQDHLQYVGVKYINNFKKKWSWKNKQKHYTCVKYHDFNRLKHFYLWVWKPLKFKCTLIQSDDKTSINYLKHYNNMPANVDTQDFDTQHSYVV